MNTLALRDTVTIRQSSYAALCLWHEGRPQAIDFDDMIDFWFVSDLAIVLFMSLREQVLRAVMLRSIPAAELTPAQARYLDDTGARVLAYEPALGLRI